MSPIDEFPFRILSSSFWILNFFLRIYFQARTRKVQISFSRDAQRAKLGFRVFAIASLLVPVYCFSPWFDFAHVDISSAFRWIVGGTTLLLYTVVFSWTHRVLGKNWSGVLEIHLDHVLIIQGPYRYIRHPMYSAFFLSGIGYTFLSANWIVAATYLPGVAFMYFSRVSSEEEMMVGHFGDSYKEYMQRTGRLFPRLR